MKFFAVFFLIACVNHSDPQFAAKCNPADAGLARQTLRCPDGVLNFCQEPSITVIVHCTDAGLWEPIEQPGE